MQPEINMFFVCALGMGTVFIGLACIILLCKIMSSTINLFLKKKKDLQKEEDTTTLIPNRPEFIAAVSSVIAEQLGTDVSAIKIRNVKKIQ